VVEEIADRLGGLVPVDNLALDVYDSAAHVLRPLFARGMDAERHLAQTQSDEAGVRGWVARHGEAQLLQTGAQHRAAGGAASGSTSRAVIVAPLRSRDGVSGVLTLERIGPDARFDDTEFELIQLFAGHVSIALQNALAHEAVEIRARTDSLTSLKNQGTLQEVLSHAVMRGTPFSLLIADLDEFKIYNDRHGHEAGNRLLQEIARAIQASCRETDEVFRYGGDEFALVLPGTEQAGAMNVASKVRQAVRELHEPGTNRPSGVSCSVGVASVPHDAKDRAGLLLAADRACYVAKRSGRDQVATAAEGLALAAEFLPQPTPVDETGPAGRAA
jgi:diguanylate cyclase (GGDEF)-like protein